MKLQALRPSSGADLLQLHKLVEGRGWRAVLPNAMPDAVLLSMAMDLRLLERSLKGEGAEDPDLAAPMFAVLSLLMNLPGRPPSTPDGLKLSQEALFRGLQFYQWAVEREVVARIVGLGSKHDTDSLVEALRQLDGPVAISNGRARV